MNCIFKSCSEAIANACDKKSFGIYYSEARNANPDIHIHECCEVFFCLSGGKNFLIGDRLYDVCGNDLFVINQFEAHKITYDQSKDFCRYVFQVSPEFIHKSSSEETNLGKCFYPHKPGFDHRVHLSNAQAERMKNNLALLSQSEDFGDDLIKNAVMSSILVDINRAFMGREEEDHISQPHSAVKLAIDYINKNFAEPIKLDSVAKASFLSVNQICRLFSEYCGTTIGKYITSKRITEAKKLLSNGNGVTETAMMCGFSDYSSFIRVFKKNVGVTPGKYR